MSRLRNSSQLSGEVLRAIRGNLTSSALSRKLGYKFDQVSRWERGERRLLWSDFVALCQARRLPLREQLTAHLGNGEDLLDTPKLIKALLSGKSIDLAAKASKFSRSKLSRWLGGKATPTFLDVYALLGLSLNTLSFLEPLVDQSKIPSLALDYAEFRRQRELAYSLPHLDALMEALVVRHYLEMKAHSPSVLGKIAGLPVEEVNASLTALEAAGMVKKVGGKFKAVELNIDYTADRRRMTKNILHWLSEISRTIERTEGQPLDGSLVALACSA
jgi:transcriptional regulator with XRE-family HTH domain